MTVRRARAGSGLRSARHRVAAALVFFAFTAPCGIAAHLISELAGLGWHDDADVAFSARHGYLALLALVAALGLAAAFAAVPRARRRARVAELVDALPFRGAGPAFVALAFVAQFAFFAITQLGEGCPLCGGDVVTGVAAAAIAALVGAIAVSFGKRRILAFALALVCYLSRAFATPIRSTLAARRRRPTFLAQRRSPFAFRYRPPPTSGALTTFS